MVPEPMVPEVTGTLDDGAVTALAGWVRDRGLGSSVTDVVPLAGGSQNIVVRLRVDGRRLVLRRPPPHPRPNSDRTMLREIAVLRTLAGGSVPHPVLVAACADPDVLGVIFYLMEEVDGFSPGNEITPAHVDYAAIRHRAGLNYAAPTWPGSGRRPCVIWPVRPPAGPGSGCTPRR